MPSARSLPKMTVLTLALAFAAGPALAQAYSAPIFDSFALKGPEDPNGDFTDTHFVAASDWDKASLKGGFGLSFIQANEYVYQTGGKLSQLIWQDIAVPVVHGSATVPLAPGWRVSLGGEAGIWGDGHMQDYDWQAPYATGQGMDDWSDRSEHPDTRTDHYLSANLRLSNDWLRLPTMRAGLNAELRYTDIQWSGYGGSFVYSTGGYRNNTGTFAADSKVITYRMRMPSLLVGGDMDSVSGNWRTSASLQGGLTFAAEGIDDHWLRDLRFNDRIAPAPVVAGSFDIGYSFSPMADIHAGISAQKIFHAYGDEVVTNTGTGAVSTYGYGSVGMDFVSATLSAGLTGRF